MVPILVVGDAPNSPSGLARIARDLTSILWRHREALGVEVAQLGINWDGSPWPWRVFPVFDGENWGRADLRQVWNWLGWPRQGVVLSVWDPARCFGLTRDIRTLGMQCWGYFAVDGTNSRGSLSGPAAEVIRDYDRVIAYGRWGSEVLRRLRDSAVPYLPHGIDTSLFSPLEGVGADTVGCVATNQARKDLGLLFEVWGALAKWDPSLRFWLHTDQLTTEAWSVTELAEQVGLNSERLHVTRAFDDQELARHYARCLLTLAPGSGEGFGYPIAESLACGVPVLHGDYAGGAELLPVATWRRPAKGWRLAGAYALRRPVFDPLGWVCEAKEVIGWMRAEPEVARAYCRGAVAHLDWKALEPRWVSWVKQGLEGMR